MMMAMKGPNVPDRDLSKHGRRRRDHSWIVWAMETGMKYNWLITLIFTAFLLMGFGFKTPRDSFNEIKAEIETNRLVAERTIDTLHHKVEAGARDREQIRDLLEASLTAQCLTLPKTVTQPAAIPCARLMRERGIE